MESGHFQFKKLPFGLKNNPATFQRIMNNNLTEIQGEKVPCYIDDLVIFSSSLQEHIEQFTEIFERLKNAHLILQPDKCEIFNKEVCYLRRIVTKTV